MGMWAGEGGQMISAAEFARALNLSLISPAPSDDPTIGVPDLCRPGLQFAGYFDVFAYERPQVIGKTEMAYLNSLPDDVRRTRLERYFSYRIPCIVIARGMPCPPELSAQARAHGVPIYGTQEETSLFSSAAMAYLTEALAPRETRHGVLVVVFDVGVLIMGESGVGKSECALELIKRGHQLVADDVVDISRLSSHKLIGESPEMVRNFMEIRGIGIIDIKSMFGIGAVVRQKEINIVVHLEPWDPHKDYDRLGSRESVARILGVEAPLIELPVRPGRNLAIIMEIAARNWRLKCDGYNAVAELDRRLAGRFAMGDGPDGRA